METSGKFSKHNEIQMQIMNVCQNLEIEANREYRGKDWRADVFVSNNSKPIAFEIQLSPQTLKKTLERQAKYERDGILGCWLFETPIPKLNKERPDLPVFYVESNNNKELYVHLGDRRKLELQEFLFNFISNKIQFRKTAVTQKRQLVDFVFYEMACWKCKHVNHLYYVDKPFLSACNAKIRPEEALWESNNIEYRPEIIDAAKSLLKRLNLKLGEIKPRYSQTVEKSYISFGCYNCDSIFGDFYVFQTKIDLLYDPDKTIHSQEVDLEENISIPNIDHWCYPENGQFCCQD